MNKRKLFLRTIFSAILLLAALGHAKADELLRDDFNYPDGLITNEYAFWNPEDANARRNTIWELDSGSLFCTNHTAWTGIPNDIAPNLTSSNGNNSAVFRLNTKRGDFKNVEVSFQLLNEGLTPSRSTPPVAWDGLHIWLHYQTEYYLYYASINRRDNTVVIKKKVPGGPSNGGTYYELTPYVPYSVPYNTWQNVKASIQTNANNTVTIKLYSNNVLLVSATDNGTVAGAPISGAGKVGIRGDNASLKFRNFVVTSLDSASTPPAVPVAPTALTAAAGNTQLTASWVPVSGATSYNLYWKTSAGVTKTNGTKVTGAASPRVLTNLVNGTTVYLVATAVNSSGESVVSNEVKVTPVLPPIVQILTAPQGVTAIPGDTQVTLQWLPVLGATSYNIYRSRTPGVTKANGFKIANAVSPYLNKGFINGTSYYMVVTAVNALGESVDSAQVISIPRDPFSTIPNPPSVINTTPGNTTISISWGNVPGAVSYNLYRSRASNLNKSNGYRIENVKSPYLNKGFVNGTVYYMVLTALNSKGESIESHMVSDTPKAGALGAFDVAASATDFGALKVFPNPWRSDRNNGTPVTFDQLTNGTTIKIFTVAGQHVTTRSTNNASFAWDLTNDSGDRVASGIYVTLITNDRGETKRNLLTVVR